MGGAAEENLASKERRVMKLYRAWDPEAALQS